MQFRISDVCWSGSGKYRCPAYFEQANVRDLDGKKKVFGGFLDGRYILIGVEIYVDFGF